MACVVSVAVTEVHGACDQGERLAEVMAYEEEVFFAGNKPVHPRLS